MNVIEGGNMQLYGSKQLADGIRAVRKNTIQETKRAGAGVIAAVCFSLGVGSPAYSQTHSPEKTAAMAKHATGTFDAKVNPQEPDDKAEGSTLGRWSLDNSST
jgi:hypothetical protein